MPQQAFSLLGYFVWVRITIKAASHRQLQLLGYQVVQRSMQADIQLCS